MTGDEEGDEVEFNDAAAPVGGLPPTPPPYGDDDDDGDDEKVANSKDERALYDRIRGKTGKRGEKKPTARERSAGDDEEEEDELDTADDLVDTDDEEEDEEEGEEGDSDELVIRKGDRPAKSPKDKRVALQRSRVPKDVVASLTDEQVDAIYAGVSARQADVDRILSENAKLRKGTQAPESAEHATPPALPDLDAVFTQVADALGGEEALAPLRKALTDQQAMLERLLTETSVNKRSEQQRVIRDSLNRVGAEFPDLADGKVKQQLLGRMKALAKTEEFRDQDQDESIDELTRAAARSLGLGQSGKARSTKDAFTPSTRKVDGRRPALASDARTRKDNDLAVYRRVRSKTKQGLRRG